MSIARASLVRGPAIITMTSTTLRTFYTKTDIVMRVAPAWSAVMTSMYGQVDKAITDRVIQIDLDLWGSWENLDVLFPSYALAPQAGASIFGTTDVPWAITGRNGDKITLANAAITKLAGLFLGVDKDLFNAKIQLTALLANSTAPEAANAYYTVATGQSYSDNAFAKTNYKRSRVTGAWGAVSGFTAIAPKEGVVIGWELDGKPLHVDGYGTVDYTIGENIMVGSARAIPIQPTMANNESAAAGQGYALGTLMSATTIADLTWTCAASAPVITLKNAGIAEHGYVFGIEPLRQGEVQWITTRGFTTGAPQAVATAA
jgi:hypothetical protein